MNKKRILIAIQYLEIGGAERSLIGLLNAIDYKKYDVDLFVYSHSGEFMNFIPKEVNLLPEDPKYSCISKPMIEVLKKGYFDIVLGRLWAKYKNKQFEKKLKEEGKENIAAFQYIAKAITSFLPSLEQLGVYDLAISFLIPHNIVKDKVKANKKWAWIHTDYSSVSLNVKEELPIWDAFDRIITISNSVSQGFLFRFPSLKNKLLPIDNILSESLPKIISSALKMPSAVAAVTSRKSSKLSFFKSLIVVKLSLAKLLSTATPRAINTASPSTSLLSDTTTKFTSLIALRASLPAIRFETLKVIL